VCLTSPELWPDQAKEWYAAYERHFWQRRITAFGFREFGRSAAPARPRLPEKTQASLSPAGGRDFYESPDWGMDVDAGPVIAGHGVAASAFGIGAARKNGRFDHAYPLSVEMLVTTWELPNGVLAAPRLLSNMSDAPLLGEASILWLLSIQPEKGFAVKTGGVVPSYVYIVMAGMLLIGAWLILKAIRSIRQARSVPGPLVLAPRFQFGLWMCLVLGAVVMFRLGCGLIGMAMLLPAVMLPVVRRQEAPADADEWPQDDEPAASISSSENQ